MSQSDFRECLPGEVYSFSKSHSAARHPFAIVGRFDEQVLPRMYDYSRWLLKVTWQHTNGTWRFWTGVWLRQRSGSCLFGESRYGLTFRQGGSVIKKLTLPLNEQGNYHLRDWDRCVEPLKDWALRCGFNTRSILLRGSKPVRKKDECCHLRSRQYQRQRPDQRKPTPRTTRFCWAVGLYCIKGVLRPRKWRVSWAATVPIAIHRCLPASFRCSAILKPGPF